MKHDVLQSLTYCVAQQFKNVSQYYLEWIFLETTNILLFYFSGLSVSSNLRSNMATGLENSRTSDSLKSKLAEKKLLSATSAIQVSKRKRIIKWSNNTYRLASAN